jgi:predicted transcriptional regulator
MCVCKMYFVITRSWIEIQQLKTKLDMMAGILSFYFVIIGYRNHLFRTNRRRDNWKVIKDKK